MPLRKAKSNRRQKMSETKTKLKWYSIVQYEEEARWLEKMHSQGWKFIGVNMPCFYHFERCEPEDYVYQLDYNKNSSNIEYKQLFEDCGWEYLTDCMGYSYFRKRHPRPTVTKTFSATMNPAWTWLGGYSAVG